MAPSRHCGFASSRHCFVVSFRQCVVAQLRYGAMAPRVIALLRFLRAIAIALLCPCVVAPWLLRHCHCACEIGSATVTVTITALAVTNAYGTRSAPASFAAGLCYLCPGGIVAAWPPRAKQPSPNLTLEVVSQNTSIVCEVCRCFYKTLPPQTCRWTWEVVTWKRLLIARQSPGDPYMLDACMRLYQTSFLNKVVEGGGPHIAVVNPLCETHLRRACWR